MEMRCQREIYLFYMTVFNAVRGQHTLVLAPIDAFRLLIQKFAHDVCFNSTEAIIDGW